MGGVVISIISLLWHSALFHRHSSSLHSQNLLKTLLLDGLIEQDNRFEPLAYSKLDFVGRSKHLRAVDTLTEGGPTHGELIPTIPTHEMEYLPSHNGNETYFSLSTKVSMTKLGFYMYDLSPTMKLHTHTTILPLPISLNTPYRYSYSPRKGKLI